MLIAIDPGMRTGMVWGSYSKTQPFERMGFTQIDGGLDALAGRISGEYSAVVVCEKFKTRPMARSYKLAELEPIRIEGFLRGIFPDIKWQWPEQRKLTTGPMKESEDILKNAGLWLTGKDLGMNDANDANAAQLHALAYLRNIGHLPTVERYWPVVD